MRVRVKTRVRMRIRVSMRVRVWARARMKVQHLLNCLVRAVSRIDGGGAAVVNCK